LWVGRVHGIKRRFVFTSGINTVRNVSQKRVKKPDTKGIIQGREQGKEVIKTEYEDDCGCVCQEGFFKQSGACAEVVTYIPMMCTSPEPKDEHWMVKEFQCAVALD
jgi:hypothetical protein